MKQNIVPATDAIGKLTQEFSKLPGIGPKSAQRITFHLLRAPEAEARLLAEALLSLKQKINLCSICCNVTETDPVPQIRELTEGVGVEGLLELSGSPEALAQGLKALAYGGRVSLLGLFDSDVKVDLNDGVIFKNARVYGIVGRRMYTTWYKAKQLLASGTLDISCAITHTFPLEKFAEAFELMASGKSGKIILHP